MTISQLGCVLCAVGVALGAFGAHALENSMSSVAIEWWETATTYLWYHAVALLALGAHRGKTQQISRAVWRLILPGVGMFSGSLYLYAFTSFPTFGMITPIGGILMFLGWTQLCVRMTQVSGGPK